MAPKLVASETDKLEVLRHNRSMKNTLDKIVVDIEKGELADLRRQISAIYKNLSGFEDYLSATIEPKYYAKDRLKDSIIAAKVFSIPELLETILINLKVKDLMPCYEVCRTFKDNIDRSTKLQAKLFLRPAPDDSPVRCPFSHENFKCESDNFLELREEGEIDVMIRPSPDSTTALTSIGSRWKAMLIRQPPIHCMSYSINCYPEGLRTAYLNGGLSANHPHRPKKIIRSENGLTVGDLYEAARTMFEQHSICPRDTSRRIRFNGPVEDL